MTERTLTRADLAESVYEQVGLSRNESSDLVEQVLDVEKGLRRGEPRLVHAEQHDAQEVSGVGLAPQAGLRHEVVEHGPYDHDHGEPFGEPITKRFDLLHESLFLHISQLFGR